MSFDALYLKIIGMSVLVLMFSSFAFAKKNDQTFKDARDGQKYRLVTIANKTWFADNLNYNAKESFCYADNPDMCEVYGRLYTWKSAFTACPTGFKLPSNEDFESLWNAAGADFNAGYFLKASYGWSGDTFGNDSLKFSAMPAGNRFDDGSYGNIYKFAFFWSVDSFDDSKAYLWHMTSKSMNFGYAKQLKEYALSVRCVKN